MKPQRFREFASFCAKAVAKLANIQIAVTDLFAVEGRQQLEQKMGELLGETRESIRHIGADI